MFGFRNLQPNPISKRILEYVAGEFLKELGIKEPMLQITHMRLSGLDSITRKLPQEGHRLREERRTLVLQLVDRRRVRIFLTRDVGRYPVNWT